MAELRDYLAIHSAYSPQFSPDSTKIAFLSNSTGIAQIYLINTQGGEPQRLTDSPEPIDFIRYGYTSDIILFGKSQGGNERMQIYSLDVPTKKITQITTEDARHMWGCLSRDCRYIAYSNNARDPSVFDTFIHDLQTNERVSVMKSAYSYPTAFSPDGNHLLIVQKPSNIDHNLYLYTLSDCQLRHLNPHEGEAEYDKISWKEDSTGFYYLSNEENDFKAVWEYDLARGKKLLLERSCDAVNITTSPDTKTIVIIFNENGYFKARFFNNSMQEQKHALPEGLIGGVSWARDGAYTFTLQNTNEPSAIYVVDPTPRILYKVQTNLPLSSFVSPSITTYKSFDGLEISCFLYTVNPQGPYVIYVHGGPESQYQPGFNGLFQYILSKGINIAAPNIRGSAGYGKHFLSLDDKEKRWDTFKDIEYLHRHLLPISNGKIGIWGGSYGGYMVLGSLAFLPGLFTCGVDNVGMSNLVTFLENTAIHRRALREAEYGTLEHDRELLTALSPIHSADKITSPLLILHGVNDPRVPVSEAQQMQEVLHSHGHECELIMFPDEGHTIGKFKNKLIAYEKITTFLEKHLV